MSIALSIALLVSAAELDAASRIVVYTLRSAKELEPLAQRLSDHALIHLEKRSDVKAIGESELKLAAEYAKNAADLSSEDCRKAAECLARVTQLAGEADRLISGHVAKLGGSFVVTMTLMDAKKAIVEKKDSVSAETPSALEAAMLEMIDRMFGIGGPAKDAFEMPAGASKLVVVPMLGLEERSDLTKTLTQLFGYELRRNGIEVWTSDEVFAFLQHTITREQCKGDSADIAACLLRFGDALAVDVIATGAVGRFDDGFVLVFKLIDARRGEVLHRVSESYRGPESQLPRVMKLATQLLLGREPEGAGEFEIITDIGGVLTVNTTTTALPLLQAIGLNAGKHPITIVDEDEEYWPYFADAIVEKDSTTRIEPELIERPVPWYRHWIFWSLAGVAVAGGDSDHLLSIARSRQRHQSGFVSTCVRKSEVFG
jgi:hypothetical protein